MRRLVRPALRVLAVLAALYALACVAVAIAYKPFLFPAPRRDVVLPAGATRQDTKTSDGVVASALRFGTSGDAPLTLVFFHGNGELAQDNAELARTLASHGYAVVVAEYRGYGMSRAAGSPSERGLYADAEAIVTGVGAPTDRVVVVGFSLGTGVAVEMASRGLARAAVLLAPYTSIPDVVARWAPVLPIHWLVRDKFDSRAKAPAISVPVLVAHGDADEVVPFDMGETLAHAFPHGRFETVSGAHHMDMFARDEHLVQKIIDFLIAVTP